MFSHFALVWSWCAVLVFVFITLAFGIAWFKRRYDIVDVAWGLGFILIAAASYLLGGVQDLRGLIVTLLVAIWGFRLASHIYLRRRNRPEDRRYAEMRASWKTYPALQGYVRVFLVQGFLMLVVTLPVVAVNSLSRTRFGLLDAVAVLIWIVGFLFESNGDLQLSEFLADQKNHGKLLTSGLWRYTRHPNYFGEITQWWGIWLLAALQPWGWLTIVGPLTITFFIIKVSGVPLLEKAYAGRPDWEAYKKRTSMLVPWPPKRS